MQRQIFVSFLDEDKRYKNKVLKWESQGKLGNNVRVTTIDEDELYDDEGYLIIERVQRALKNSSMVLILVGEDNMDHPWLDWEGEFCHQWGIKRYVMRIPYTDGDLPDEFKLLKTIAYNPNAIEKELRSTETNQFSFY